MKKLLLTLVLLVGIVFGLFAQNLTYQAVVRDNNQQLVVNTAVTATVTITFSTGTPATYKDTVNGSTNIHGLLSFEFGNESLKGRDWTGATIAVKVVNAATPSTVYVNDDARPVSAVPYALSVDGQSVQNYLTEHHYVDLAKLNDTLNAYPTTAVMDGRHYLTKDSTVITTMQSDIAELKTGQFDCNKVKDCIKDTLGKYTPTTDLCNVLNECEFSGQTIAELLQGLTNQISDLKEQVDSLSNLPHGGGDEPTEVADGQPCPGAQTVKDIDGNTYNTVKIGSQCWTKENMKTKKYADGTDIDSIKVFNPNNSEDNVATYGKLYTWSAATRDSSTTYPTSGSKVHGICPAGWHVPSDAEWDTLTYYVYNSTEPDYKCSGCSTTVWKKSTECIAKALATTTGWSSNTSEGCNAGNTGGKSNLTGFSAVPAGRCFPSGFGGFGVDVSFWSATEVKSSNTNAWCRYLNSAASDVKRNNGSKSTGFSVRCLRDAGIGGTPGENETGGTTPSAPATMSCDDVMNCLGDTLGRLNDKIVAQGQTITTQGLTIENLSNTVTEQNQTITEQGNTIDSLARIVDSLSNLSHGGGDTPTAFTCGTDKVKDVDNNEYNTVQIGNQCWMAQNLRTNVDGSVYPKNGDNYVTGEDTVTYGRLYTWAAMMKNATSTNYPASGDKVQGICPAGWHVPSDAEWDTLTKYVYNSTDPNYKCSGCLSSGWEQSTNCIAKALATTTGWSSSSDSGCNAGNSGEKSNLTGFAAVPAGNCFIGSFTYFGSYAYFWSATENEDDNNTAWYRSLGSLSFSVNRSDGLKNITGYSVRCLRDAGIGGTTPSAPATMSCDDVMNCLGDTLGKLNNKIEAQGTEIETLKGTVTEQGNTIDSLAHIVDSLSQLSHGGGDTPTAFTCGTDKVKDVDNNEYPTVQIGNQCWMAQNLRTDVGDGVYPKKNSGTEELEEAEQVIYGRLYTWAAVTKGASTNYPENPTDTIVHGICPAGWHVPSDAEWDTLTYYVFNSTSPDYKCGSSCGSWAAQSNVSCIANALSTTTGWSSNTSEGCNAGNKGDKSNLTGFSAVPAGNCVPGYFNDFGYTAYFWSATQYGDINAWCRNLSSFDSIVGSNYDTKAAGFSVRCLRDN